MIAGLAVLCAVSTIGLWASVGSSPAFAGTISSDRAQANQLVSQIAAESAQVDHLAFEYDKAQQQYQQTAAQLAQAKAELAAAVKSEAVSRAQLRADAVAAYMGDESAGAVTAVFDTSSMSSVAARAEYQQVSDSHLQGAIDRYRSDQRIVAQTKSKLAHEQAAEQVTLTSIAQTSQQAQAAVNQENLQLSQVKANLQQALLQRAHAIELQRARAAAARAAAQAAAQAAQAVPGPGGGSALPAPGPVLPPSASWQQQAAVAVKTGLAQVGKPYVWGGAGPNDFDCSGLVMYAWEAAGVNLPHYSVSQYDVTTHVPASDLQPGDIVFYNSPYDGALGHEALYIGGGQVVQAPMTGMNVQVTSITWAGQPVAYGQP
ncbi:MAG: NlpC/P60 family protein [Actinomycetota bacterium]|nr:NlpC/P60 family protein [Actinomycetota bacterium]